MITSHELQQNQNNYLRDFADFLNHIIVWIIHVKGFLSQVNMVRACGGGGAGGAFAPTF